MRAFSREKLVDLLRDRKKKASQSCKLDQVTGKKKQVRVASQFKLEFPNAKQSKSKFPKAKQSKL